MSSNLPGSPNPLGSFADKLTIETPEQTALDFAVAGVGSRFLALAVDTLIQMLVGFVVGLGGSMATGLLASAYPRFAVWGFAILVLLNLLLYFGCFAFFEIIWNGQTPGKRKAGIRVIKDSGRPLSPAESIARNLMRIVDWLPFLYAVGIASAMLTKENKRLGDLVAGSLVVRESSFSDLKPAWHTAQAPTGPALSSLVPIDSHRRNAPSSIPSSIAAWILNPASAFAWPTKSSAALNPNSLFLRKTSSPRKRFSKLSPTSGVPPAATPDVSKLRELEKWIVPLRESPSRV